MVPGTRALRSFAILIALVTPMQAAAQWAPGGVPIGSDSGLIQTIGAASDLNGGAYVAWEDYSPLPDGRVQHVRADGTIEPLWPAGGYAFCEGPWTRYATSLISDDMGGAYIAWLDDRSPPADSARVFAVYMSRISYGGSVPGWNPSGTPLCAGPCTAEAVDLAHDTFGGVFASWSEFATGATRLMHMDADGRRTPGWPASGVALTGHRSGLAPDGQGGAFVSTDAALYHLDLSGRTAPGWPASGFAVSVKATLGASLVADDSGGVYCVWSQIAAQRDSSDGQYAQHIRFDGTRAGGWPEAGVRLSRIPSTEPMSVFWVNGGAIAAWASIRDGESRVLAQRLEPGGVAPDWPPEGVALGRFTAATEPRGISDGGGGAFVVWDRGDVNVNGTEHASLQHVLADGQLAIGWPAEGIPLSLDEGSSTSPFLAAFTGPAIVAWTNPAPAASQALVRVARVTDIGPSLNWIRPLGAAPSANGIRVEWFLAARYPTDLTIERQDRLGWTPIGTVRGSFGIVGFTDTEVRPGSSYRYRLSVQVAGIVSGFGEMTVTVPLLSLQVRAAPANPARGELAAEVRLPHTAPATLELFDASGRLLERREIAGGAPRVERYALGTSRRLASGVYFLRVTQLGQSAAKRVVFLR
jgi:hypothetical protein